MPIFNENWEHLPLNPIHLQPQLTPNSTENDNAYKRKFTTLKSYFRAFGNIWEQIWGFILLPKMTVPIFYSIWQHLGTILSEFEAIFVNYSNDSIYFTWFCNIWEQFWVSLRLFLSITAMTMPIKSKISENHSILDPHLGQTCQSKYTFLTSTPFLKEISQFYQANCMCTWPQ